MTEHIAIFGATSAIAAEVGRLYAARGARLYLVGRSAEKMSRLVSELGDAVAGSAVQDFERTDAADGCVHAAVQSLGRIDIVLIAHGLLGDQHQSQTSLSDAERVTLTNYLSVVALLMPLANHLEQQRGGHIAVLSSVAAERGRPRNYTYAAAKGALNIYMQGMRSRLHGAGVQVHTLKLGPVDTPMTAAHPKNWSFARVPLVARQVVSTIDAGASEAFVPNFWRPIMFTVRNLPEFVFQRMSALSGR